MLKLEEIVKKVGADRIRKAMESQSGEALKNLFDSEGIELTPEQLDYIAGGIGLDDYVSTGSGQKDPSGSGLQ